MICTNCGKEVPEGKMYCEECGTELHMVPEYDAAVEKEIDDTLLKMAKEIRAGADGKEETTGFRFYVSKRFLTIAGISLALIIAVLIIAAVLNRPPVDHVERASAFKEEGDIESAMDELRTAIEEDSRNAEAILMLAEFERESGDDDASLKTLDEIVNSAVFGEEETRRAFRDTADIYLRRKDYTSLFRLMQQCPYKDISENYLAAMPDGPSFYPGGGSYEEALSITLAAQEGSRIYYVFAENNERPDNSSLLYTEPVVIDEDGTFTIRAIAYDTDDVPTLVSEATYNVTLPVVSPPKVLEDSGVYTQATKIVVFAENGSEIYYTVDGSEPDENSTRYTTPITMPRGKSLFRFVAVNEDGEESEIVDREYELSLPRYVTQEQAVANVINALIAEDVLLDESGKTRGEPGHNVYIVQGIIMVSNTDEYYEIHEQHLNEDGTSENTGLFYAVNTNTGATYRLGYDSAGKYLLVKLQ